MKKMLAIAAAAATVMGAGSAFAADRLSDTEMDAVSAGGFGFKAFNIATVKQTNNNNSPATAVSVSGGGKWSVTKAEAVTVNDQSNKATIQQNIGLGLFPVS